MWVGFAFGVIGPAFGFIIYYLSFFSHKTLDNFWNMVHQTPAIQAPLLSLTLIFNLVLFLGVLKLNMNYFARGILLATFMYVPIVIFLKYF